MLSDLDKHSNAQLELERQDIFVGQDKPSKNMRLDFKSLHLCSVHSADSYMASVELLDKAA